MKYKIALSEDETYVRVQVFETINGNMEREFAGNAIKIAKQRKINKFLVDVRGTPNIANSIEHYLLGYEDMNRFGLNRKTKIAILADTNDLSHNFIETVIINAGYRCRVFPDEDAALEWLGPIGGTH